MAGNDRTELGHCADCTHLEPCAFHRPDRRPRSLNVREHLAAARAELERVARARHPSTGPSS